MHVLIFVCLFVGGAVGRSTTVWQCKKFDKADPLGSCGLENPRPSWGAHNIDVVKDPARRSRKEKILRISYPEGSCVANRTEKGGTQFKAKPFGEHDALTLQYRIRFSDNFKFVRGGKLVGFWGGTGKCSGGLKETTCFSTRFMWRANGDGEVYAYIPNETGDWFCDLPNIHCNFKYGHSLGRGTFRFIPGKWHRLSQYIKLNTPGKKDSVVIIRFDGAEVFRLKGLTFRVDQSLQIDALYFSTFFGGGTLDWASEADVDTYYKDFKVRKSVRKTT